MTPSTAVPFPQPVLSHVLAAAYSDVPHAHPVAIATHDAHSNDRVTIRFSHGRTLVVKRARETWAAARFAASRHACDLIHRRTGILAPKPLDLPPMIDGFAVEAYWRIDRPTLAEEWKTLPQSEHAWALRHWGRLMARLHGIRLPGHGALAEGGKDSLAGYLQADLGTRLLPAVQETWPEAARAVDELLEKSGVVALRADRNGVLVHNDLHLHNVLCERTEHTARSVGVLDLEAAFAGPPEADMAHTEVLHGPLLGKELPEGWIDEVLAGYGRELDPTLRAYFRSLHLLNFGYHASLCGWDDHAADLLDAAEENLKEIRTCRAVKRYSAALSA